MVVFYTQILIFLGLKMKRIIVYLLLICMLCIPAFADTENSISDIACGDGTVFVLMDDGKLIAWGDNSSGLIPDAGTRGTIEYDERHLITMNAQSVVLGPDRGFMIDGSNVLYGWGKDGKASLLCGIIDGGKTDKPVKLMDSVRCVSCGTEHNAAVTLDGTLWIWGKNTNGSVFSEPREFLNDCTAVCCNGNNTAAIANEGQLYAWGEDFGCTYPQKFADGIVNVTRGCGASFILQDSANEILLMQCCVSEDGSPEVMLTAPVASNVSEITDYGYIRDDGTLWMCRTPDGNTFVPSAKNVSLFDCTDMNYRVILSGNKLRTDNFEFDRFKNAMAYRAANVDLHVLPESDGIVRTVILGIVFAIPLFIIAERPRFYLRLRDRLAADIREEFGNSDDE